MSGHPAAGAVSGSPTSTPLRRWEMCRTEPGAAAAPAQLPPAPWAPALVPGTVASARRAGGDPAWDDPTAEQYDWWYRCTFAPPRARPALLVLDGLATHADVWLNGVPVLHSTSMFARHRVDVSELLHDGDNELTLRFAALAPVLGARRARGRWRARLVDPQSLRWVRTSLLGRTPGWRWTPPIVGPWRRVELQCADRPIVREHTLEASCSGQGGRIAVHASVLARTPIARAAVIVEGSPYPAELEPTGDGVRLRATVCLDRVERWWPHTHGPPRLYDVGLLLGDGGETVPLGRVGFRTIELDTDGGAFVVRVNGERVFCRGGAWMPLDGVSLQADAKAYVSALTQVRDAGMNMLRVSGVTAYEHDTFHECCDELGILVWQDLMFSTMDYPDDDPRFAAVVREEAASVAAALARHPSTALFCGNNEVEQQAAMLGVPSRARRSHLFDDVIAGAVRGRGVPYWPSSPSGGTLPFHPSSGDAHYFGYGAFLRESSDVRLAGVRFASECLALAHVPEPATVEALSCGVAGAGHHPAWKRAVPRDAGASWDFEDVRDHYLERMFAIDARTLRRADPERYLALGRLVSVELVERTLAEWRRGGSPCAGAIAWTLRDLIPGAGWGLIDACGRPKAAFHAFARLSRPIALFPVDEGLNGVHWHAVNDSSEPVEGTLVLEAIRHGAVVTSGAEPLAVGPRGAATRQTDALIGGFTDAANAYRFAEAAYDGLVATWRCGATPIARAIYLPAGMHETATRGHTTLTVSIEPSEPGAAIHIRSSALAVGVAIHAGAWIPDDNYFHMAPGEHRVVRLRPLDVPARLRARITALNATATCTIADP